MDGNAALFENCFAIFRFCDKTFFLGWGGVGGQMTIYLSWKRGMEILLYLVIVEI